MAASRSSNNLERGCTVANSSRVTFAGNDASLFRFNIQVICPLFVRPRIGYPASMPINSDYLQYVLEQLTRLPRVTSRRMFGGVGLYSDGVFFGIIANDTVFFKVDDSTRESYTSRGSEPFRPYKDRPDVSMSYFQVPADILEDADELVAWARTAVRVATASAQTKRTPSKRARRKTPPGA